MPTGQPENPAPSLPLIAKEMLSVLGLATPLALGLAGGTAFSAIDSYMLSPIGELALASASLTNSVLVVFYSALFGLVCPVGILAGEAYGAGRNAAISSIRRHGLVAGLIGGGIMAALMIALLPALSHAGQPPEVVAALPAYWIAMALSLIPFAMSTALKLLLDSIGRPWIAALLTLLPVAVVIPLNWMLIYGHLGMPKLGLVGAGLATLLAQTSGYLFMRVYIAASADLASYRSDNRINCAELSAFVSHGLPMAVQYLAESGAVGVIGLLIGLFGSTALAANQIAFSLGALVYMIPLGTAGAVGILVAQAKGEGSSTRVSAVAIASFSVVTLLTLPFTVAMLFYGRSIASWFVADPEVVALAAALFVTIGAMQVFDGLQSVALGALRGLLDNRWPTAVALIAYWLIAIPLSVVFGFYFGYGPAGIWGGFGIGVALASVLLIRRFFQQTAALDASHRRYASAARHAQR
jgi:MATE family multidrug resistance protein